MAQDCGCGCDGSFEGSHARCFTRGLKNERFLRENAPQLFSEENSHGLPFKILQRLHRLRHDSPLLNEYPSVADFLKSYRPPVPRFPVGRGAAPLFNGVIYFAQVSFNIGSSTTPLTVSDADIQTIVQYAKRSSVPISAYCAQYGPNHFSISSQILKYHVDISSGKLANDQIKSWVNDMKQLNSLPNESGIFLPCPNGISGDAIGENAGYHDKANIPYIVAGVWSTKTPPAPFTIDDGEDVYAMVVSHEIAELIVDPNADQSNPEVCDPCDLNCSVLFRLYFDAEDNYLGSNTNIPPGGFTYEYYICAIVQPAGAGNCPSAATNCQYEPWIRSLQFITGKSSFARDDVLTSLSFSAAFWLQVQGFTNESLHLTTLSDLLNLPNPPISLTASVDTSLNAPNNLTPDQVNTISNNLPTFAFGPPPTIPTDSTFQENPQTFLYPYTVNFSSTNAFDALNPDQSVFVTVIAAVTIGSVSISAATNLVFSAGENPRFENLNTSDPTAYPSWLSFDLRFLKVTVPPAASRFGATMSSNPADAPGFIASVVKNLTAGAGTVGVDSFESLTQGEGQSALEFLPTDRNGHPVFNFAIARVRLRGNTPGAVAKSVRVFFRLFHAQSTATNFDTNATYRYYTDGKLNGKKISLLGVQNGEYVTVPCFATPRINFDVRTNSYVAVDMSMQADPPNVQDITVIPGSEVDTFFGCWLDFNLPNQKWLPSSATSAKVDGPFTGPLISLNEAFSLAPHQCLVAEISSDDAPIPAGANTSDSDKLAQRNIAWIDGPNPGTEDSRRMPHPLDILGSPVQAVEPDVLIIFWNNTPQGSIGNLYLPAVNAKDILGLAETLYGPYHTLTATDQNTVQTTAGQEGATLIPLPASTAPFAGLLTVDLPAGVAAGDRYNIVVQQTTIKSASSVPPPPPPPILERSTNPPAAASLSSEIFTATEVANSAIPENFSWREVTGMFQISIIVRHKESLLFLEERLLSWLRWKLSVIPLASRWFPVLQRYEQQVSGRVGGFGGDPGTIVPSPVGDPWDCGWRCGHCGKRDCRCRDHDQGYVSCNEHQGRMKCQPFTGKVCYLEFDHSGEFVGFSLLMNSEGKSRDQGKKNFYIREGKERRENVCKLVERCMVGGRDLTVYVGGQEREREDEYLRGFRVK